MDLHIHAEGDVIISSGGNKSKIGGIESTDFSFADGSREIRAGVRADSEMDNVRKPGEMPLAFGPLAVYPDSKRVLLSEDWPISTVLNVLMEIYPDAVSAEHVGFGDCVGTQVRLKAGWEFVRFRGHRLDKTVYEIDVTTPGGMSEVLSEVISK